MRCPLRKEEHFLNSALYGTFVSISECEIYQSNKPRCLNCDIRRYALGTANVLDRSTCGALQIKLSLEQQVS